MDSALFLQKITAQSEGIFPGALQKLWLRQGRNTKAPLCGTANTDRARSGQRPILLCGRGTVANMEKEKKDMSKKNNRINVPEAREAMDKFKMEAASEVGVNLKEGYNGDISAREAGSVGGQMVKNV